MSHGPAGAAAGLQRRLPCIEALRGLAATAVVLCHVARHMDRNHGAPWLFAIFQPGHAGVDLFFVLSGFIIMTAHGRDIGCPHRVAHFLARRATRVLPLYWVALGVTVALGLVAGHPAPGAVTWAWSLSLLPSARAPLLGIAWTLQYEMLFYALFALLILNRWLGAAAFGLWFLAIAAAPAWHAGRLLAPQFDSRYGVQFFFGMAAACLRTRWDGRFPMPVLCAGAAGVVLAMALEGAGRLDGSGDTARLAYGLPAALLVLGAAAAERSPPGWLMAAGGASFAIYLFQFVFIGLAWQALRSQGLDDVTLFLVLTLAAIAGGLLTARILERPLLDACRRVRGEALASPRSSRRL